MTANDLIQLINGCGFPIVACCALAWFIVWDKKQRAKEHLENRQNQENILSQLKVSVDNNSRLLEKIIRKVGVK